MTERAPALPLRSLRPAEAAAARPGATFVLFVWSLALFDPQWFIPSLVGGGAVLQRAALLLVVPALFIAIQHGGLRVFYWPVALLTLLHVINVPLAMNRGLAIVGFKDMLRLLVLLAAAASVLDTPDRVLKFIKLFLVSFLWFIPQGLRSGHIGWHTELGNPDGYGAFAAMAVGFGYYFATSTRIPRWRYLGFAASALGVLGIVASFARGAAIAGAMVLGFVWLRSPRKLQLLLSGAAASVVFSIVIELMHPGGGFWAEMATIAEGTSEGTGSDRMALWTVGWMVFKEYPILGAGAHNAGVVGSMIVPYGMFEGMRYKSPETLYNMPLHNTFVQILSEEGLVGIVIWLIMLVDFWRRLHRMRSPTRLAEWRRGAADFDLRHLSYALETAMIGFLASAIFYNCTYRHWFFTLLLLAILLSEVRLPASEGGARRPVAQPASDPPARRGERD